MTHSIKHSITDGPVSITVLGATGSIGVSTLDVIARHPDRYRVFALTANRQVDRLFEQCLAHSPAFAVMVDEDCAQQLELLLSTQNHYLTFTRYAIDPVANADWGTEVGSTDPLAPDSLSGAGIDTTNNA